MQSPVNATPIRTYSPLGKVPVVSLTQDLPPGVNADCLLLECGDARNILYTFFCEENNGILYYIIFLTVGHPRKWDITCSDLEPAIIGLPPIYPFYPLLAKRSLCSSECIVIHLAVGRLCFSNAKAPMGPVSQFLPRLSNLRNDWATMQEIARNFRNHPFLE